MNYINDLNNVQAGNIYNYIKHSAAIYLSHHVGQSEHSTCCPRNYIHASQVVPHVPCRRACVYPASSGSPTESGQVLTKVSSRVTCDDDVSPLTDASTQQCNCDAHQCIVAIIIACFTIYN